MSKLRAKDPGADVLEPKLTQYDQRILHMFGTAPETLRDWRLAYSYDELTVLTEWQVAERLREDDVRSVRQVLAGLQRFGYLCRVKTGWAIESTDFHETVMQSHHRRWAVTS